MPPRYPYSSKKSARIYGPWRAVYEVACIVLERAKDSGKRGYLVDFTGTSWDTWMRCAGHETFGGWTADRIMALRDFERAHLGTDDIDRAMSGATQTKAHPGAVERDADKALCRALDISRTIADVRPDGIDAHEARALLAILPDALEALAVLQRDCKARLKAGAK